MDLIIGGYAQGKLNYVLGKYHLEQSAVWDKTIPKEELRDGTRVVVNRFHEWIKERMQNGGVLEEELSGFLDRCPDCIIISDEVGNGIVPLEAFDREYRERLGKILIMLAGRAKEVERVVCGIGQKIK
ncbi:MAG: bifunctional adenosylcobinamide kinase/adenosylcobinamide-phosphate guanylyltransferase [Lachnospiraceae bacterium]|nr:bifunctional adenosylcobinamide kinase/adenosylcobinamide-phosphate guanylyltransferase [Lachnospiraceae bacterium]